MGNIFKPAPKPISSPSPTTKIRKSIFVDDKRFDKNEIVVWAVYNEVSLHIETIVDTKERDKLKTILDYVFFKCPPDRLEEVLDGNKSVNVINRVNTLFVCQSFCLKLNTIMQLYELLKPPTA